MKFFKQTKSKSCNIIAIQHVLSFFNQYPSSEEIKKELPKHAFGSTIKEIQDYLKKQNIKTNLQKSIDKKDIYMYDGANFKRKVKRPFKKIYKASLNINESHENGMWLITK